MENNVIKPHWPAPNNIKAFTTLRSSGNVAMHTRDDPRIIQANRALLKEKLRLPQDPLWLKQTHSTIALEALDKNKEQEGDASFTHQINRVCVVLTADCLPILLCNEKGTHIAAIHAGWRGLLNGIIESTLHALDYQQHGKWLAWFGPAISAANFEVGSEVLDQFLAQDPEAKNAFVPSSNNKRWLADLYALARYRLQKKGISAIFGGEFCTYADAKHFYSYRREGLNAGRMASLIWISDSSLVYI